MTMKSNVNLFSQDLRPVKKKITLTSLAVTWLVVVATGVIWAGLLNSQYNDNVAERRKLQQIIERETTKVDNLRNQAQKMLPDAVTLRRVERARKEYEVKRQVLDRLQDGGDIGQTQGYSPALTALSAYHDKRISLTQILLVGDQTSLWGNTAEGRAIPQWLEGLSRSDYFTGRSFDMMTISRSENNDFQFSVESKDTDQPDTASSVFVAEPKS